MGFLTPLFLVAVTLAGIPFLLHLLNPHETRRISFPALRYLQRTEREHARRIRLRQLLVLLLRTAVILLLVLAGARLFVRGKGVGHDPTALALVLDNSMSSGLVIGEERVLDQLESLAEETLGQATSDDRIWVIRAGEPWDVAPPGGPAEALRRVRSTSVSAGAADLEAALVRARELVEGAGLPASEIDLLSDLQASAFSSDGPPNPAGDVPVVVYHPELAPAENHYLHEVLVGGGLPPVAGQRSEISVSVGAGGELEGEPVALRLVIGDRIQGASSALPGRTVVLPVGPFGQGRVEGYVETDPDALRADDRRHFVFTVRPPPNVAVLGEESFFLDQALLVLAERGRIRRTSPSEADVLVSVGGEGLEGRAGKPVIVVPAADPTLLPALNRRMADSGIPWRMERPVDPGETTLGESRLAIDLGDVRVRDWLVPEPLAASAEGFEVPLRLSTGEPWLLTGGGSGRPYLLLASPLDERATTLPISAAMVPLLEWATSRWSAAGSQGRRTEAGTPLSLSGAATQVETPDGTRYPVDGTQSFPATRDAGIYSVLQGDSLLERVAVDPPARESLLARLDEREVTERLGSQVALVSDPLDWPREVFVSRQGPELWKPLLVAALLLLLLESWIAAPGGSGSRGSSVTQGEENRQEVRAPIP